MTLHKRYICSFCARSFSRSEHKLRHERSHTKEKPFKCNICSNGFVRRDLLQRHLRTVHRLNSNTLNDLNDIINVENSASVIQHRLPPPPPPPPPPPQQQQQQQQQMPLIPPQHADNSQLTNLRQSQQPQVLVSDLSDNITNTTSSSNSARSTAIQFRNITNFPVSDPGNNDNNMNNNENSTTDNSKDSISLVNLIYKFNDFDIDLDYPIENYLLIYSNIKIDSLKLVKISDLLSIDDKSLFENELIYIIISLSSIYSDNLKDSIIAFNLSWTCLIKKIKNSSINFNSGDKFIEFIDSLLILSHIYINYYINYHSHRLINNLIVKIDTLFEYLNNIISTQILYLHNKINANTTDGITSNHQPSSIKIDDHLWSAYILLSQYSFIFNKSPSSLHLFLVDKPLPTDSSRTLTTLIKDLNQINNSNAVIGEFNSDLIICSLINELQILKFNESTKNKNKNSVNLNYDGIFKNNKNFLHNAIILSNRSFNSNLQINSKDIDNCSITIKDDDDDLLSNLLTSNKKRLLINCPLNFTDLLSNYLILPTTQFNWILLSLTLKEFLNDLDILTLLNFSESSTFEFDLTNFIGDDHQKVDENIKAFISCRLPNHFKINNNLGITSLPLLFISLSFNNNAEFLNDHKSKLHLPKNTRLLAEFFISNYLIIFRILLNLKKKFFKDIDLRQDHRHHHYHHNHHQTQNRYHKKAKSSDMNLDLDSKIKNLRDDVIVDYDNNIALTHDDDGGDDDDDDDDIDDIDDIDENDANVEGEEKSVDSLDGDEPVEAGDGDGSLDTDDDNESCILSVLIYVLDELGTDQLFDEPTKMKKNDRTFTRSNSISIGEFSNNNEKIKRLKEMEQVSRKVQLKKFKSLKEFLLDDYRFYKIVKNIEKSLITWLSLLKFENKTFVESLKRSLNVLIYSKLHFNTKVATAKAAASTSSSTSANLSISPIIPPPFQFPPASQQQQQQQQQRRSLMIPPSVSVPTNWYNKAYSPNDANLFNLQQRHHDNFNAQNLNFSNPISPPPPMIPPQPQSQFSLYNMSTSPNRLSPQANNNLQLSSTSPTSSNYQHFVPNNNPSNVINSKISLPPIQQIQQYSSPVPVSNNNRFNDLIQATLAAEGGELTNNNSMQQNR